MDVRNGVKTRRHDMKVGFRNASSMANEKHVSPFILTKKISTKANSELELYELRHAFHLLPGERQRRR